MLRLRSLVLGLAGLALAACATVPPVPPGPPASPPTPTRPTPPVAAIPSGQGFEALAGWAAEDHLAALSAVRAACAVKTASDLQEACARLRRAHPDDDATARAFLEANFRAEPASASGLLTAYFAPEYEARASRGGEFTAPVRGRPEDLVSADLGAFDPTLAGKTVSGRLRNGRLTPYPDRAAIEAETAERPLAWMRPEDLFFLQIQGSGVLTFADGRRMKAAYAGDNGRPFVGVAAPMRDKGLLADSDTSADRIRGWLADHRGSQAEAIMRLNPRYIFFRLTPDDGVAPAGASGVVLPPGRALAVDPTRHAMGELYWIDAEAPVLTGAFPVYRRLAATLDIGGAIKGEVRADLFTGSGAAAGAEAGRVRHTLHLYRLTPLDTPAS